VGSVALSGSVGGSVVRADRPVRSYAGPMGTPRRSDVAEPVSYPFGAWVRSLAILPLVMLIPATALALVGPAAEPSRVWPTIALAAATALWLSAMAVHQRWAGRMVLQTVYYLGLVCLTTALVAWNPFFMLVSWVLCVHAFLLFEARWAFFGAAAGGVLLTVAQAGSVVPTPPRSLPLFLLSLVVPLVVAGWYLGRETEARRRLIAELAARDERQRIAREIHDTLAQDLSAAVTLLEGALAEGREQDRWKDRVRQARDMTREGLSEARRSVRALGPPLLDHRPLAEALPRLVHQWQERTGIPAAFRADGADTPLAPPIESALFRIAQSALANVAEHAGASQVHVTLSCLDDRIRLDVRDDGIGFDPAGVVPARTGGRGFGLAGVGERVRELGGTIEIESGPGTGTTLCVDLPAEARSGR
jgi:signal transduction histidine kinase